MPGGDREVVADARLVGAREAILPQAAEARVERAAAVVVVLDEQRLRVVLDRRRDAPLGGERVGERVEHARVQRLDAQPFAQIGDRLVGAAEPRRERAALEGRVQPLVVGQLRAALGFVIAQHAIVDRERRLGLARRQLHGRRRRAPRSRTTAAAGTRACDSRAAPSLSPVAFSASASCWMRSACSRSRAGSGPVARSNAASDERSASSAPSRVALRGVQAARARPTLDSDSGSTATARWYHDAPAARSLFAAASPRARKRDGALRPRQLRLVGIGQHRRRRAPALRAPADRLQRLHRRRVRRIEGARLAVVVRHLGLLPGGLVARLGEVAQHQRAERRRQLLGLLLAQREVAGEVAAPQLQRREIEQHLAVLRIARVARRQHRLRLVRLAEPAIEHPRQLALVHRALLARRPWAAPPASSAAARRDPRSAPRRDRATAGGAASPRRRAAPRACAGRGAPCARAAPPADARRTPRTPARAPPRVPRRR